MSSSIVGKLIILPVAEAIANHLRTGNRKATLLGTFLGAGLTGVGFGIFLGSAYYGVLISIPGAIVGACVAAAMFKAPTVIPPALLFPSSGCGALVSRSTTEEGPYSFRGCTLFFERAVYLVHHKTANWERVSQKLFATEDPALSGQLLISLECIEAVEKERTLPGHSLLYLVMSERKSVYTSASDAQINDLIDRKERQSGTRYVVHTPTVTGFQSVSGPVSAGASLILATIGLCWLSDHWIKHPPPNPVGKNRPDELVSLLRWAGPTKLAVVGTVAVTLAVCWLIYRIMHPRHTTIYAPADSPYARDSSAAVERVIGSKGSGLIDATLD